MSKQQAILDAALELFAQKGEKATTTREIAKQANTSEGNIYRHFESKKDLALQLFEQSALALHQFLENESKDEDSPDTKLTALITGIFKFARRYRQTFDYLLSVHHTGVLQGGANRKGPLPLQLFSGVIQEGTSLGQFKELDSVLAAGWMVAMAQRTVILVDSELLNVESEVAIAQTIESALQLVKMPA